MKTQVHPMLSIIATKLVKSQTLHELKRGLNITIVPGTEVMRDVGSRHFLRSSSKSQKVLISQPSDDSHGPSQLEHFLEMLNLGVRCCCDVHSAYGPRGAGAHVSAVDRGLPFRHGECGPIHWGGHLGARIQQFHLGAVEHVIRSEAGLSGVHSCVPGQRQFGEHELRLTAALSVLLCSTVWGQGLRV